MNCYYFYFYNLAIVKMIDNLCDCILTEVSGEQAVAV